MKKRISVVIATLNEGKWIEKCLNALSDQTIPRREYEIIVVDGKSRDKTASIARKYADRVLVGPYKPIGYARDAGLRKANTPLVALTDADTIVPRDWLESYIAAFEDPRVVGAYGNLRYIERTWLSRFYELSAWSLIFLIKPFHEFFHGFNICMRKSAAISVGGFLHIDKGEDALMGRKLKKIGRIIYVPTYVRTSFRRLQKQPLRTLFIWAGLMRLLERMNLLQDEQYEGGIR